MVKEKYSKYNLIQFQFLLFVVTFSKEKLFNDLESWYFHNIFYILSFYKYDKCFISKTNILFLLVFHCVCKIYFMAD